MRRVVVTDGNVWPWLRDLADDRLSSLELTYVPWEDREAVRLALAGADAYVGVQFDARDADAGRQLEFVQITAAGVDHTAVDRLAPSIPVANSFGHGPSIAEHVLMVSLAVRRRLLETDASLRRGKWRSAYVDPSVAPMHTLADRRALVIGFGHIGRHVARALQGIGMQVTALRRTPGEDRGHADAGLVVGIDALDDHLPAAEVVVLACPLTESTRGLIDGRRIGLMRPDAILVNVARGPVVDEDALFEALHANRIAGAALDTWWESATTETRMPARRHFGQLRNVIMTPHYAATAVETYRDRALDVADDLADVLAGDAPRHAVRRTAADS